MKKIFYIILAAISAVSVTACANNETPSEADIPTGEISSVSLSENAKLTEETAAETAEDTQAGESNAALIVYFSWSGNTESLSHTKNH